MEVPRAGPCLAALLLLLLLVLLQPLAARAAPWLDDAGRPTAAARAGLRLLAGAADDGLRPQDYRAEALAARAAAPLAGPAAAVFERELDEALQRYLRELRLGRVDPRGLGFRVARPDAAALDIAGRLHAAARAPSADAGLDALAAALRPQVPQYARLREALAAYRTLEALPAFGRPLPGVAAPLRPGAAWAGAPELRERLAALGDLPAAAAPTATDARDGAAHSVAESRYDAALAAAVRRFQLRHGLEPDGVLGAATRAALDVPPARRVRQLELALERLRWLPDLGARPFVAINIAMFRLWAREPATGATPLDMGVVVGRALDTQTPLLHGQIRHLIFRPYWNVPRSILRKELLPALARDPLYLQRHDMEIVRGPGDDAVPVALDAASLAGLNAGSLRLRQRPGPRNSLGLVKFIFPNDADVYLHGTPATQLFGRARRDFSHGCVRVEDPVSLATWLLRALPGWTREQVEAAMQGPASRRVDLPAPMPVLLFYLTATVMPGDGTLHFADDLYGHDARLERALAAR